MKNILVPVDFSKTSDNAMWYAAEIASKSLSGLVLLHVYQFPYISPEIPGIITPSDEIEMAVTEQLKKKCSQLHKKYGKKLRVAYAFRFGGVEEEIERFARIKKVSLVVMGMQGSNPVLGRIFGNVASGLIRKLKCPVLTIGQKTKFKLPNVITLAYDYKPVRKPQLDLLKNFAGLFKAHICVVYVAPSTSSLPDKEHLRLQSRMQEIMGKKKVSFYYIDHVDLSEGMKNFMVGKNADMIAMFPASHNLFSRLWLEPHAKQILFQTKFPLLTIHK